MRKMLVMTGLVAAVSWGAVTAWAGPRTARRTVVPSVSRTAVASLSDAVRSVPTRLGFDRVPAAQPLGVPVPGAAGAALTDAPATDVAAVVDAAATPVPVTVAVRADVVASDVAVVPAALAVQATVEAAGPGAVTADPIVEATPLIAVYAPPAALETAPVGLAANATPAAAAAPVEPAAPATVEVVQCGGPDGWETVPEASACPGDRALRIERVPVDA